MSEVTGNWQTVSGDVQDLLQRAANRTSDDDILGCPHLVGAFVAVEDATAFERGGAFRRRGDDVTLMVSVTLRSERVASLYVHQDDVPALERWIFDRFPELLIARVQED